MLSASRVLLLTGLSMTSANRVLFLTKWSISSAERVLLLTRLSMSSADRVLLLTRLSMSSVVSVLFLTRLSMSRADRVLFSPGITNKSSANRVLLLVTCVAWFDLLRLLPQWLLIHVFLEVVEIPHDLVIALDLICAVGTGMIDVQ